MEPKWNRKPTGIVNTLQGDESGCGQTLDSTPEWLVQHNIVPESRVCPTTFVSLYVVISEHYAETETDLCDEVQAACALGDELLLVVLLAEEELILGVHGHLAQVRAALSANEAALLVVQRVLRLHRPPAEMYSDNRIL